MPGQPNIVVVMSDDHGQWASGAYGCRELSTPNLDWLARSGAKMSRAFTPSPVCSPARACFFTGLLPSQHGVHDWIDETRRPQLAPLAGHANLAQLLQTRGYRTGLVGKWHCGQSDKPQPGFDSWFSYSAGQLPHCGQVRFSDHGREVVHSGHQAPELTRRAISFLKDADRNPQPFFLFVGYVDTHSPFQDHPQRLVERYERCAFCDVPDESPTSPGWVRFGVPESAERRRQWLAQYFAAVTLIDEQVGALVDELDGLRRLDDTLFIYTSDHGHLNGHHGLYTKGNATVPQNFFDESILVPLILRWPGVIAGERERAELVDHCDLFATVLDAAAGASPPPASPGRSFLPMFRSERAPWRDAQFCEYGNARMIRTDQHKLIRRYSPHDIVFGDELYDLAADPRERVNRINDPALAALRSHLSARLDEHFHRYELSALSGREIGRQVRLNDFQPWDLPLDPAPADRARDERLLGGGR